MEVEKRHRLMTVSDFVAIATPDNLQALLTDFAQYLTLVTVPTIRPYVPQPHCFEWIDDGKHDVHLQRVVPDAANPDGPPIPCPEAWVESDEESGTM